MASAALSIDEICAQAALRNVALRQATQQASETLCFALRAVTGSSDVPKEFLPQINAPAPDLESLLALIDTEEPEKPIEAIEPDVPDRAEPTTPSVSSGLPPAASSSLARAARPTSGRPGTNPAAGSPRTIDFQPVAWPTFGATPPAKAPVTETTKVAPSPRLGPNEVYFEPGQLLFSKGDPADRFYVIRQGQVALFEPSTQKQIATLDPGTSFGEQAILVGGVRSVSARAIDGVVCLALSAKALREMLELEQGSIKPVFEALLLQLYLHNDLHARGHRYNA